MKKIQSLFKRDYTGNRQVINEVVESSEWVINGEGKPTVKFDGTPCMVIGLKIYRRFDAKNGRTIPEGDIPCQEPDKITGHWPHWVECNRDNPADKYFFEAFDQITASKEIYTVELCGPKINGNKEGLTKHGFLPHGLPILGVPRTYEGLKLFLKDYHHEGIVWHHPDGRMVKIKRKDFGLKW